MADLPAVIVNGLAPFLMFGAVLMLGFGLLRRI